MWLRVVCFLMMSLFLGTGCGSQAVLAPQPEAEKGAVKSGSLTLSNAGCQRVGIRGGLGPGEGIAVSGRVTSSKTLRSVTVTLNLLSKDRVALLDEEGSMLFLEFRPQDLGTLLVNSPKDFKLMNRFQSGGVTCRVTFRDDETLKTIGSFRLPLR
jgi:hypothetical protein